MHRHFEGRTLEGAMKVYVYWVSKTGERQLVTVVER